MATNGLGLGLGFNVRSMNPDPDGGIVWVDEVTNPDLHRQGLREHDVLITLNDQRVTKVNFDNVRLISSQNL